MIHELKEIITQAKINQDQGLKNVLVTLVDLEGSSYRKPGVRMLISENQKMIGAVSGGCVEKEILHKSTAVFKNNKAKIITYDGRYKLGCEGLLYILIEPFLIADEFYTRFTKALEARESITISSSYIKENEVTGNFGTSIFFENSEQFVFSRNVDTLSNDNVSVYKQILKPAFHLIIIGGEHDAVKLCQMASFLGWQVEVITSAKDAKTIADFPGANWVMGLTPEMFDVSKVDVNTGIVIMNHSYVQDLKYLLKLIDQKPAYLGILGAAKRRDRMFNELFEHNSEISEEFLESIFTPAGLHIGAQTPEEIAVSILAEILSVIRGKDSFSLRNLNGKINT